MKFKASHPNKTDSSSPKAPIDTVSNLAKYFSTCLTSHMWAGRWLLWDSSRIQSWIHAWAPRSQLKTRPCEVSLWGSLLAMCTKTIPSIFCGSHGCMVPHMGQGERKTIRHGMELPPPAPPVLVPVSAQREIKRIPSPKSMVQAGGVNL